MYDNSAFIIATNSPIFFKESTPGRVLRMLLMLKLKENGLLRHANVWVGGMGTELELYVQGWRYSYSVLEINVKYLGGQRVSVMADATNSGQLLSNTSWLQFFSRDFDLV